MRKKGEEGRKGRLAEGKLQEEMKKGNGKKARRKEPAPSVTRSAAEARARSAVTEIEKSEEFGGDLFWKVAQERR